MVTIYALINPINGEPFYIGATKYPKGRLSSHLLECNGDLGEQLPRMRRKLIKTLKEDGYTIELIPILICDSKCAAKCEAYVYNLAVSNGITLLQSPNRFNWKTKR